MELTPFNYLLPKRLQAASVLVSAFEVRCWLVEASVQATAGQNSAFFCIY
jgi:hypothetical protein